MQPATTMHPSTDTTTVIAQVSVTRIPVITSQEAALGSIEGTSLPAPKTF